MSKHPHNYLLVKSGLGTVRPICHSLPPQDHAYGKQLQKGYGVRQVLWNWVQGQRTLAKESGKDYVAMNRQGIKHGYIDSKQLSYFCKNNEIKLKAREGQRVYGLRIPVEQFAYGLPNRPSTPIKNIIGNSYALDQPTIKQQRQAVLTLLDRDRKKSLPQIDTAQKNKYHDRRKQIQQHNFKLAKFINVPSKIKPLIDAHKAKMQNDHQHSNNNINNKKQNQVIQGDHQNAVNKK